MRDSRWRDAKSKRLRDSPSWLHIFFNLFVSLSLASLICPLSLRISFTRNPNLLLSLRISFTRIPYPLFILSHLVYSHPASAPNLFVSRLPVSRICSCSLRISFTRIPNLLLIFSYPVYPHPASALHPFVSRLPASRICSYLSHLVHSHPVSASKLYPVQKSSKMLE